MGKNKLESKFQTNLIGLLKKRNCRVVNFAGSRFMEKGIADLRVTHTQWKGWIELKVDDNKLTSEQDRFLKTHCERGDNCLAVWLESATGLITVFTYQKGGCLRQAVKMQIRSVEVFVELLLRERKKDDASSNATDTDSGE